MSTNNQQSESQRVADELSLTAAQQRIWLEPRLARRRRQSQLTRESNIVDDVNDNDVNDDDELDDDGGASGRPSCVVLAARNVRTPQVRIGGILNEWILFSELFFFVVFCSPRGLVPARRRRTSATSRWPTRTCRWTRCTRTHSRHAQ